MPVRYFIVAVLLLTSGFLSAQDEKIHTIDVDLRTPQTDFRLVFERETTPRVQVPVYRAGFSLPAAELAGWTGILYYAQSDGSIEGMSITGEQSGSMFDFVVPSHRVWSNGTYFAQLLFTRGTDEKVQEWRRGKLTIRGAGGADAVQATSWNTTNMLARIETIESRLDGHDSDIASLSDAIGSGSAVVISNLNAHIAEQVIRDSDQDGQISLALQSAIMGGDAEGPSTNMTVVAIQNIPVAELFPGASEDGYGLKYDHATGELILGPVAAAGTAISNIVVLSSTATATDVASGQIGLYRTIRPGNLPSAAVNVGGYEVAWFDLLGITLRAGTLMLLGDWLTVNVKAYDGTIAAPSRSYAAQPDMGTYRFSTGSGYAEGFAVRTNGVWYWDQAGIHLQPGKEYFGLPAETDPLSIHASSAYVAWTNAGGAYSNAQVIVTSPLFTNGVESVTWQASGNLSIYAHSSTDGTNWIPFAPTAAASYVRITCTNDLPLFDDPACTVSDIQVTSWTRPDLVGHTNDTAGQQILVDAPQTARAAANKAYVDAAAAGVSPASWADYPAVAPIRANGQPIMLGGGWTLQQSDGFGVMSQTSAGDLVIANNGVPGISIASGLAGLRIDHFSVDGGTGTVGVATNGAVASPVVQWTTDLGIPQWTTFDPLTTSYPDTTTNNWYEFSVELPDVPDGTPVFLRAVCESGTARIDAHSPLYVEGQAVLTGFQLSGTNLLFVSGGITNRISMEVLP